MYKFNQTSLFNSASGADATKDWLVAHERHLEYGEPGDWRPLVEALERCCLSTDEGAEEGEWLLRHFVDQEVDLLLVKPGSDAELLAKNARVARNTAREAARAQARAAVEDTFRAEVSAACDRMIALLARAETAAGFPAAVSLMLSLSEACTGLAGSLNDVLLGSELESAAAVAAALDAEVNSYQYRQS